MTLRLREECHEVYYFRFLLRYLNITKLADALAIVTQFFDADRIPPKTTLALEELLGTSSA